MPTSTRRSTACCRPRAAASARRRTAASSSSWTSGSPGDAVAVATSMSDSGGCQGSEYHDGDFGTCLGLYHSTDMYGGHSVYCVGMTSYHQNKDGSEDWHITNGACFASVA